MKSRIQFSITIGLLLLILGITRIIVSGQAQEPVPVYAATINRDCAPWDGSAFTASILIEASVINISIYQSPDIGLPVTFSFPDNTGNVGNVILLLPAGMPEQLKGKVTFQHVAQGNPVEGNFDLVTDQGQHRKGKFKAEWGTVVAYCG